MEGSPKWFKIKYKGYKKKKVSIYILIKIMAKHIYSFNEKEKTIDIRAEITNQFNRL